MLLDLHEPVVALMRQVARDVVMPRFRNLAADEIAEKAADDFVTIADKESELRLSEGLSAILPEAGIIGEEACAADPAILDCAGEGLNWIIDPIDGTGNFAAGNPPFGIMVALADAGTTLAGWILDPLTGRLCHALLGGGSHIDGQAVRAKESGGDLPIAALAVYFMTAEERADIQRRAEGAFAVVDIPRCAAEQYPRLVLGQNDVSVFARTLPWDHAAGTLFVNEAGGCCQRLDGTPYVVGDLRRGLLGASSPRLWEQAARQLFG
ncbi:MULTISPECIES: inositol monophosphatase family protein [Sphingobium]|jgi:fructose-1,6-bisphosphatase/inositol monophosphatase family enzyme|uniref:inositol monophosphatase family protein n=1 Tax=Sphingobium TaxID=165695 RepID=UPI000C50C4F3|nr:MULTISPECIES: inositol monophosphatase family protein [Sphingobium]MAX14539.1 inositol monophosphatase [Sphingobium sp.]MBS47208.1 inositol monophosphatase [Sphingobium sp.]MCC4258326.1 inositol monophosphatase [Sphingobium lactosutens]MEE2741522.1 inositol monophosphatase family protein [Pseudomonadota bacterium]|tara:strand:- start:3395 stop:4192 length:798 start_codon:yes stop_codon:yes gene_type:complete